MLWPVGRISTNGFSPLSQLLHSAANGVRAASSSVRIMVHLADGWDTGTINWFYGGIFLQGQFAREDVDILGFSFYPFYNTKATYANLANGLQAAVSLVGKVCRLHSTNYGMPRAQLSVGRHGCGDGLAGYVDMQRYDERILDRQEYSRAADMGQRHPQCPAERPQRSGHWDRLLGTGLGWERQLGLWLRGKVLFAVCKPYIF